jgi:carbonic anhydrase/acetyltransferase-like protein (isoleucine patch superfamily)
MGAAIQPVLGRDVYVAPTSYVAGEVTIGDECTVMHHVVIRADIAPIRLGARVNVQDGSILHTADGVPLDIGDEVGIGHRVVVHCRSVGRRTLIGIGAVLLDDCEIGSRCIVAAGCVLPPKTIVPDGKVVMGVPAQVVRDVSERDLETIDEVIRNYRRLGRLHAAGQFPNIAAP